MRGRGILKLVLLVSLGLSIVVHGACASSTDDEGENEDDVWEDIEEDEEDVVSATKSKVITNAIVQLTDRNAESFLNSSEYVMLLGYASWCKQSAAAMVDYAEAAVTLKGTGSSVVFARVDAVQNKVTASKYKIKGFPTVLFFKNGSFELYTSGLAKDDIVNWVQKHSGHITTTVSEEQESREILNRTVAAVMVGYFEKFDGPDYEAFLAASSDVSDVEFIQTTVSKAAMAFSPELVKKVPSFGMVDSDGFELMDGPVLRKTLVDFANLYKYPMVTKLHSRNVGKIYSSPLKKHVILFSGEDDFEDLYDLYRAVAGAFKNKLMFVWVDMADEDFAKPMLTMYGITDSEPSVAGFDNSNGMRYFMDADVTKENLLAWADKLLTGQLPLHYKSERVPSGNNGDVVVVVGKTFQSLVLERTKDMVLLVHTPYCYDCESMRKVFEKLAKHFRSNSSLVFAKIDASANEHPGFKVSDFPSILFYAANTDVAEPVVGPSKPLFKKLVRFVADQLKGESKTELKNSDRSDSSEEIADSGQELEKTQGKDVKVAETDTDLNKPVVEDSLITGTVMDLPILGVGDQNLGSQILDLEPK